MESDGFGWRVNDVRTMSDTGTPPATLIVNAIEPVRRHHGGCVPSCTQRAKNGAAVFRGFTLGGG